MSESYDNEDDDDESGSASFSMNMSMPTRFSVGGVPDIEALQKENERLGASMAADMGKTYDDYAKLIRDRRIGPTRKEQIIGALAAFAQPTRSGKIGEALGNSGGYLSAQMTQARQAQEARDDTLAKLGFERDTAMAKLRQAYGLSSLKLRADAAKAGAKGGNRKAFLVPADETHGPRVMTVLPDGSDPRLLTPQEVQAQGLDLASLPPAPAGIAAPSAVPPPPAPPTAAEGGPPPTGRDAVAVGESYVGPDGATYLRARVGAVDKKIAEPSPDFVAKAEGLKKGSQDQASATVATQTELEKSAREVQPVLAVLTDAKRLLDSGLVVTGVGAKQKLVALQIAAAAGDPEAKAKVEATQQYINAVLHQLGPVIKQFGSGTAISDSDRKVAEGLVGADTTLETNTLKWINDLQGRLSQITLKQAVRPDQARDEKARRAKGKLPPLSSFRTD